MLLGHLQGYLQQEAFLQKKNVEGNLNIYQQGNNFLKGNAQNNALLLKNLN